MNAIVLMAIGDRYTKLFKRVRCQFEDYAAKCNANLVICSELPDPTFKRNILAQKMLLPGLYRNYKWIAYIDLDVIISDHAPSIFDHADESKAFAAIVDPRGSTEFANVVNHFFRLPRILQETHESYFSDRGFPDHPFPKASINGGVFLCKTDELAQPFREFYFSGFREMPHEEAMMAYVSQSRNLFYPLDGRFNDQIIYEIYKDPSAPVINTIGGTYFRALRKLQRHLSPAPWAFPPQYRAVVRDALKTNYIVHFSAGFPFAHA